MASLLFVTDKAKGTRGEGEKIKMNQQSFYTFRPEYSTDYFV